MSLLTRNDKQGEFPASWYTATVDAPPLRTALRKLEIRAPLMWWRHSQRQARMVSSLITRGFEAEVAIAAVNALAAFRENHNDALDDQQGNPTDLS